eukprot:10567587-Lingulodinium_polyedra.AAC.1
MCVHIGTTMLQRCAIYASPYTTRAPLAWRARGARVTLKCALHAFEDVTHILRRNGIVSHNTRCAARRGASCCAHRLA